MFRRHDGLIVSQWEHSRISGVLAKSLGASLFINHPQLFGAIALHDWPHFAGETADTIEIGHKSAAQQQALTRRLAGPLPLDTWTELIVRLHWNRLNSHDATSAKDDSRIPQLLEACTVTREAAGRLDRWTEFCDLLAFHLSRGDSTAGQFLLPSIADVSGELIAPLETAPSPAAFRKDFALTWTIEPVRLVISGVCRTLQGPLSMLAYHAENYPTRLTPHWLTFDSQFLGPSSD